MKGFQNTLLIVLMLLGGCVFAQVAALPDSIPRIVQGKVDWQAYKKKINAPTFQQNDYKRGKCWLDSGLALF